MKKNIVLESYNRLFLEEADFDSSHLPQQYVKKLVDAAINSQFENDIIKIAGYKLSPARCLQKVDPLAYKEYFENYCYSQGLQQNNDGTYVDTRVKEFAQANIPEEQLVKECCKCCGQEFLHQELDPESGYCMSCQEDELLNGPKQFQVLPSDSQQTIIIKQSCMKRWKETKTNKKGNK